MTSTSYLKDYDTLLQDILTKYQNLDSSPDITVGSAAYIQAAVLASMLWGLYKYDDYLANQVFIDTCDTDSLNRWGSIFAISRLPAETDNDFVNRILSALRQPPAGGTLLDYQNWAIATPSTAGNVLENFLPADINVSSNLINVTQDWLDQATVWISSTGTLPSPLLPSTNYYISRISATQIQLAVTAGGSLVTIADQGAVGAVLTLTPKDTTTYYVTQAAVFGPPDVPQGTVSITITPNDLSIIGTGAMTTLVLTCQNYIDSLRPVTSLATVTGVTTTSVDVTVLAYGKTSGDVDYVTMEQDIQAYITDLLPGETLYTAQLTAICIRDGAISVIIVLPTGDWTPARSEKFVPGNIVVTPLAI